MYGVGKPKCEHASANVTGSFVQGSSPTAAHPIGIGLEQIAPGHPEQNGRHERLHLTLKTEATRPPSTNVLQQPARFDTFVHQFNHERPHQALEIATPASRYQSSARVYQGLEELEYPHHDWTAVITTCGRICYQRRKVHVSQVFAGQKVGVKQTDDHLARDLYGLRLGILRR